jgi:hypothetical protein
MRGTPILIIFFLLFTTASVLVPIPLFPGSFLSNSISPTIGQYAQYVSAVLNGIFYGSMVWLVFIGLSRKLEQKT